MNVADRRRANMEKAVEMGAEVQCSVMRCGWSPRSSASRLRGRGIDRIDCSIPRSGEGSEAVRRGVEEERRRRRWWWWWRMLVLVLGGLGVSINGGPRTLADSTRLDTRLDAHPDARRTMNTEAWERRIDLVVGDAGGAFYAELLLLAGAVTRRQLRDRERRGPEAEAAAAEFAARGPNSVVGRRVQRQAKAGPVGGEGRDWWDWRQKRRKAGRRSEPALRELDQRSPGAGLATIDSQASGRDRTSYASIALLRPQVTTAALCQLIDEPSLLEYSATSCSAILPRLRAAEGALRACPASSV
ncbi:hypothetical protein N431DRAFT_557613 [Stipitochalara longipes BDJ]|nr:hypothetical protein N431DRAFT_557613 [Stipitochalara longipes BDJ]